MKNFASRLVFAGSIVCCLVLVAWQVHAEANRVTFPENLDRLVHYTTVDAAMLPSTS